MTPIVRFPGLVQGLGAESARAAQIYAELTGRAWRWCEEVDELVEASSVDVVVCRASRVTARLMHRLFVARDGQPGAAPGVIVARDGDELVDVCRKQAASAARSSSGNGRRVFIDTEALTATAVDGNDVRVGGSTPHDEIVALLESDPAVLTITGHSDGIDIALSLREYACPFTRDPAVPSDADGLPPCRVVGKCTRYPTLPTAQEAEAAKWVVPLSAVHARIATFFSCSVVKTQDTIVDPMHGLAAAMLRQADVGAVLSTWREERDTADGAILNELVNDVSAGIPAGEAVARFNRSAVARRVGSSFCIIGDPCVALDASVAFAPLKPPEFSPQPVERPGGFEGDMALLLDATRAVLRVGQPGEDTDAGKALEAWLAGRGGDGVPSEPEPALDASAARFLATQFRLEDFFGAYGVPSEPHEDGVCPICGGPARDYMIVFERHRARARRVIRCSCCLESANFPADWAPALDLRAVADGIVGLSGVPSRAHVRVALLGYYGTNEADADWTKTADGRLTPTFRLPELPTTIPAYCKVFVSSGLQVGAFGFKLRRRPNGRLASSASMRGVDLPGARVAPDDEVPART